MKPIFSTQIIARATLWAFILMAEILIEFAMRKWSGNIGHFSIYISSAFFVFLMTFSFGKSKLAVDFRDLCFYDVVVHCVGWWIYEHSYNLQIFYALAATIWSLKFIRILWPLKTITGDGLADWPAFGPFGYWQWRQQDTERKALSFSRQDCLVYVLLLASFPVIYLLREWGLRVHLAYSAALGLVIILCKFKPFMLYLEQREIQHLENAQRAAAQAATEAKNAELAAKNIELALAKAKAEQSEQEKQAAFEQLHRLNLALCDTSHDLRGPIAQVQRRVQELVDVPSELVQARQPALEAVQGAMAVFTNALDSAIHDAMLATGQEKPTIRAVNVLAMFDQFFDDWIGEAQKKGFACIRRYPKGVLPPLVATDQKLLWRILQNLVVNGISHGGAGATLVLSVRAVGQHCVVRVWDTGPGIAGLAGKDMASNFIQLLGRPRKSKQQRTQQRTQQRSHQGHGLGLHIVSKLSQVLGVQVGVRSIVGRGTLFRFCLPLAKAELLLETKNQQQIEADLMAKAIRNAGSRENAEMLWPFMQENAHPTLPGV